MDKDWIEKQVFENKDRLNHRKAPADLWNKIEVQLDAKQQKQGRVFKLSMYKIAAIFIGVLTSGVLIGKFYFSTSSQGVDPAYLTAINMAEEHYGNEINQVIDIAKKQNIYNTSIEADINQLDRVYNDLKDEMLAKKDVNNKIILNEMIKNYKLRISLLEALIDRHQSKESTLIEMKNDTI